MFLTAHANKDNNGFGWFWVVLDGFGWFGEFGMVLVGFGWFFMVF